MADEIVVKYDGDVKKLEDKLKGIEAEQLSIEKNAKKTGQTITDQSEKSAKAIGKVEKQTVSLKNSFNDLAQHLPFAGAIQQANQLTSSLVNTGKAVTGVSGTMKILKFAIASTGIGLLVTMLASLVAYFKSTEEGGDKLAKIMGVIGAVVQKVVQVFAGFGEILYNVGETIYDLVVSTDEVKESTDDYKKSVVQLAAEIADLEDHIEALTVDIGIQNAALQAAIEENLKKLRNQNLSYKDGLDIIKEIGKEEQDKLNNSNELLNEELKVQRKKFINRESELRQIDEDIALLEKRSKMVTRGGELDRQNTLKKIEALKETRRLEVERLDNFEKAVNGEITTEELLAKAKHGFKQEDQKELGDLLVRRIQFQSESSNLEVKLDNLKTMLSERDRARQEKSSANAEKAFQDKLKRIALEEKLALGMAKVQEKNDGELILIEQQFNQERIELLQAHNRTRTGEYQELLFNQVKLEKDYTDFLKKEDAIREAEFEKQKQERLKREQKEKDDQIKLEEETSDALIAMWKKNSEQILKDDEEKRAKLKAGLQQGLQEAIALTSQALTSLNDLQLARATAEIDAERNAQAKITEDRLMAIDTRAKAGVISETQANSQKLKIQRDAAKKESELKKRQFEAEQKASINRVNISTAEAIVKTLATYGFTPLAAIGIAGAIATGELQKAVIRAQPVPKFEEGGIIKGKRHREGGVIVEAEGGERIFSRKKTKEYEPLFKSIQEGYFDKYADENFVRPALKRERERNKIKEERDKAAYEYMRSMSLNGLVDTSQLERLTKKNKSVRLENSKEIVNGIVDGLKSKSNRGL
jgi:hypothetical protein